MKYKEQTDPNHDFIIKVLGAEGLEELSPSSQLNAPRLSTTVNWKETLSLESTKTMCWGKGCQWQCRVVLE